MLFLIAFGIFTIGCTKKGKVSRLRELHLSL